METAIIYEIIGYVASVLIAVSLMMSNIIRLRVINLIGAGTFSLYGVLIESIPVAAMNGFIVLINIYFLFQMFGNKEFFKTLEVKPTSNYLRYFLEYYEQEIKKFQPEFEDKINSKTVGFLVLRDLVPAGLLLGELDKNGIYQIRLDFVIPNYRDFKIGRYLFDEQKNYFREVGVRRFEAIAGSEEHQKYLRKMGFEPDADEERFVLNL